MRKKIITPLMFVTLCLLLIVGCDFFRKGDAVESVTEVDVEYLNRDSTLYGVCGRATTDKVLQLITDTGDTLQLSLAKAKEDGLVMGSVKVGERMAVVANIDSTLALNVINITAMLGDWVTEDAIDGGNEVGITLKDGGVAESINHTTIQYRSWRLINGFVEIANTRDDGADFEERTLYCVTRLTADSLVLKEVTKSDYLGREDIIEYCRQKPKEEFNPGFELEESNFDDFVF